LKQLRLVAHAAENALGATASRGGSARSRLLLVTVVLPVRDEEQTVAAALESLARQTVGPEALEVLVLDGGSADRTAEICHSFSGAHPWGRFEVLENTAGTVPHALNAGLAAATCEWFAVIAGRTTFSPDYVEACLTELKRSGPGVGVGGRFVAEADGPVERAVAAAVTHRLGVGRGFRTDAATGDVAHHPFAIWRRADVLRFGAFDQTLERNQDDEFCMRAARQGARIRLLAGPEIRYRPRERYRGLAAQYFQYGLWKSVVGLRTGLFPKRSLAPAAATAAVGGSIALAAAGRRVPFAALVVGYVAAGSAIARERGSSPALSTAALALVHLSYGAGVIAGALHPGLVSTSLGSLRLR
jgi:succinoglycan biosynthesis protein ExoA